MMITFGCSWPLNVMKSWKSRTTQGKSLPFLILIWSGYIFGIMGKLLSQSFQWYVLLCYILNLIMVSIDLLLYARNYRLDKQAHRL